MAKQLSAEKKTTIENIILLCLYILLFYPPFFRGLFFEKELLSTHIFSFVLGIVWVFSNIKKKEYKLFRTPIDLYIIGVVFMYIVSTFYAVNMRLAIIEALKYVNYFVIYLLSRDLLIEDSSKTIIMRILIIAGGLVAIVGLGSAIGTWNYHGAYVKGRITSTFQYANALASYLAAINILSLGLSLNERKKVWRFLYGALSNIMFITFVLTLSRGMWIILPILILIYVILIPNNVKFKTIVYVIVNGLLACITSVALTNNIGTYSNLLWVFILLSSIVMGIVSNYILLINKKINVKKAAIGVGIFIVIIGGLGYYGLNSTTELKLSNATNKDKWTNIRRDIEDIEADNEYILSVEHKAQSQNSEIFSGRISIDSIDENGQINRIKTINIFDDGKEQLDIEFSTLENTDKLSIKFGNFNSNTHITFKQVTLTDKIWNKDVEVPLKYKYLPESMVSRVFGIKFNTHTARERVVFYKDASKIIKDYFLLGTGGGGWTTLYHKYQSYNYSSTQAHNYYVQMMIEIGFIGILIFLIFLISIFYSILIVYIREKDYSKRILIVTVATSSLSLLVHALMDFDLSLVAITFILWSLLGMMATYFDQSCISDKKIFSVEFFNSKMIKALVVSILVLALLTSASFKMSNIYAQKAIKSYKTNNVFSAIRYFEKASGLDPFKAEYIIDSANLYKLKYNTNKDKKDIIKAKNLFDKSLDLTRYNTKHKMSAVNFYMSIGSLDKALSLIDEVVLLQPLKTENYLAKSKAYISVFKYFLAKRDETKAKETINKAYNIKDEIKKANLKAMKPLNQNDDLLKNIGYIQFYYENIKADNYKVNKDYVLDYAYYFDMDINNDDNLDNISIWNSANGGKMKYESLNKNNEEYIRVSNNGSAYSALWLNNLDLKPNSDYILFAKVRGKIDKDNVKIDIYNPKSKNKVQTVENNIELMKDEWNIVKLDFKTQFDIEQKNSSFRLWLKGSDTSYMDIEQLVIFKKVN